MPETAAAGLGIGLTVVSCYAALMVVAYLIADTGFVSMDEGGLMKIAQGKFIGYFLFLIIYGLALGVAGGIPIGIGMASIFANPEALAALEADPEGTLLTYLQDNTATLLFLGLIAIVLINLISTVWFLVPVIMVGRGQGLASMGTSSKLIGQQFGRVFVLSLISILVNAALLILPLWLVLVGQMPDNLINSTLIGIPQGIGYAFALALGVVVWRRLDEESDASSVFV